MLRIFSKEKCFKMQFGTIAPKKQTIRKQNLLF